MNVRPWVQCYSELADRGLGAHSECYQDGAAVALVSGMATKTKKQRQTQEQKLLDAVTYAASCLKEAGDPLHGLGPSQQYADAFHRYTRALKNLVAQTCPLHVADWSWDGYEGNFHFYWEFSAQLAQPGMKYDHNTRSMAMRCPAGLDPQKPLLEELARLREEAEHYDEMRGAMLRWASDTRARSLAGAVS